MADDSSQSAFERIVEVLLRHGVEFMVVGGQAEALYGGARVTYDTDVCYRRSPANLERLAAALRELGPTLRNAPPDLPFRIDAQALALGSNFTFETKFGQFDLLGWVEPFGEFDALVKRAATVSLGPVTLQVIDLDDLIRIKQHIQRPKDRDSLMQLLAIKRIREEGQQ